MCSHSTGERPSWQASPSQSEGSRPPVPYVQGGQTALGGQDLANRHQLQEDR